MAPGEQLEKVMAPGLTIDRVANANRAGSLYWLVLDSLFTTCANTENTGSGRNGFAKIRAAFYDADSVVFLEENAGV